MKQHKPIKVRIRSLSLQKIGYVEEYFYEEKWN